MRKNATKIAAMVLSLALTVTSVNVPTTSSAAAKVKLNKTKATLTVGKTTKLVAKVNGKKVKATFTSSNAKVAKVAKKTGKVTAKKAGTAKITAKYNGKKAVCKVTVKAKATPTVAPTAEPTVEPTVAPTAEPTVEPTMEPTMAPVVKKEAANIEMTLVNPFDPAHIDTVLIGTNAELRVKVTDEDGNPVAGESVVISDKIIGNNGSSKFKNKADTVETTNEKGYATFVYGTDEDYDATDYNLATNLEVVANVAGTGIKTKSNLKFAGITFSKLDVLNENDEWDAYPNPVPGTNKLEKWSFAECKKAITRTMRADQKVVVEYVNSNQVSAPGADHPITLKSSALLVMPQVEKKVDASEIVVPVNFSTGKYGTYTNGGATNYEKVIEVAEASDLQYATVNFDSINLSKHTRMIVDAYIVKHPANPWDDINNHMDDWAYKIDLDTTNSGVWSKIYEGKMDVKNQSLQIPIDQRDGYYLFVTAKIVSKGQVDTDNNNGFVLRDIVGVYDKTAYANKVVTEPIAGVTINWAKNENPMYEVETALTGSDSWTKNVYEYLDGIYNSSITDATKKYTFKYSVPAFPFTGNAVITVYDANKKAVAYWAKPTANERIFTNNGAAYRNVNIFANDGRDDLYQITEAEAKNVNVGTVTTDADGNAKVDSTATGVTHVIGTITSTNPNVVIDASNSKLYSSVQWNPIANADRVFTRKAGAALAGQIITVNAQLIDRNGNPVKKANEGVAFKYKGDKIQEKTFLAEDEWYNGAYTDDKDVYHKGHSVEVISCDTVTDATGKAQLVLTATDAATLVQLEAVPADTRYNVAYTLGNETVTANYVDLYWIDANLKFESSANSDNVTTPTTDADPYVDATGITPKAGTNWEYAVYQEADRTAAWQGDALNDYALTAINGVTINTAICEDSVGTATNVANGKANVTSKQAGWTFIENVIDSTSFAKDVTFTFTCTWNWTTVTLPNIGEGTPNIDKKLTLNVNWDAAETTASIIIPTGLKGEEKVDKTVYVKVVDAFGNAKEGEKVSLTNGTPVTPSADDATLAVTDGNGIAKFTVTGGNKGTSTTVVARVIGIENAVATKSIQWVELNKHVLAVTAAEYDYDTHSVTIKFDDHIEKASVVKEMFTVMYGDAGAAKEQIIGKVTVSGKAITLSLPALNNLDKDTDFTVSIATDVTVAGIDYTLSATDGEIIAGAITDQVITVK